jgi:hypothetical protein
MTSDNVAAAGVFVDALDAASHFAANAVGDGMVSLGGVALGLAGLGLARYEQRKKEKR